MCINAILHYFLVYLTVLGSNVYNAGKVREGTPILHVFKIANFSEDTIKIEEIRRTCGCTTVSGEKRLLKPKDTFSLYVKVNTYGYRGEIEKSVYVFYSTKNGKKKHLKLKIKATIFKNSETPLRVFYKMREGIVFDLRDKNSYRLCHIAGSENLTEDSLLFYLKSDRLRLDKGMYLYLVVNDSIQGENVVEKLREIGFRHSYYIDGGIDKWIKEIGKSGLICSKQ